MMLRLLLALVLFQSEAAEAAPWRIMAVGDSITEGGKTFACYRPVLAEKLRTAGLAVEFVGKRGQGELRHEGYGGKNVEFLARTVPAHFAAQPADIVLLHAGHNHFVEEQPVPGMVAATEQLIAAFRAVNPRVIVLLAQVIPAGKLPKYSYLPAFNAELARLAARLHTPAQPIVLVDQATGFDWQTDTIADLVHPNAAGAEKMAARWLAALQPILAATGPDEVLLYTYFRDNGQAGVCLAQSADGVTFTPLNGDRPVFTPPAWAGQNLTRDASILYRDGVFRMVWTTQWKGRVFGYAESRDLVTWSEPRQIRPFPEALPAADQPDNIWAPELHWDPFQRDFFVLFASTTPRERTDGDGSDNKGNNTSPYDNRIYLTRTTDGGAFSPARLFFDQGFSGIDAVMRLDTAGDRWVMVVKCSRDPDVRPLPGRNLRLTFTGPDLNHPHFTPISAPIAGTHSPMFSHPDPLKSMAEGQSLIRYRDQWWLYWDEPAGHGLQLATSPDLATWTHMKAFSFPAKAKHGTAFLAPRAAVGWLRAPGADRAVLTVP